MKVQSDIFLKCGFTLGTVVSERFQIAAVRRSIINCGERFLHIIGAALYMAYCSLNCSAAVIQMTLIHISFVMFLSSLQ